ncbi:MAG: hypothetical protein ACD_79C00843G0001, partial [uncultured bacterium]
MAFSTNAELSDAGTGTVSDFNFYDANSATAEAHSIGSVDPSFVTKDSGTVDANTTTTMIIDAGQSWTANQWTGYA